MLRSVPRKDVAQWWSTFLPSGALGLIPGTVEMSKTKNKQQTKQKTRDMVTPDFLSIAGVFALNFENEHGTFRWNV